MRVVVSISFTLLTTCSISLHIYYQVHFTFQSHPHLATWLFHPKLVDQIRITITASPMAQPDVLMNNTIPKGFRWKFLEGDIHWGSSIWLGLFLAAPKGSSRWKWMEVAGIGRSGCHDMVWRNLSKYLINHKIPKRSQGIGNVGNIGASQKTKRLLLKKPNSLWPILLSYISGRKNGKN